MIAALVPTAPTALIKVSSTQTQISLSWTAPSSNGGAAIRKYNVYSNMGSGSVYSIVGTSTTQTFTNTNLSPPGMTLVYKVSAVNDVGEGPQSATVSIILGTIPNVPLAPTLVSASPSSINITWTAPSNGGTPITQYSININNGPGYTFVLAGTSVNTWYIATGLVTGVSY